MSAAELGIGQAVPNVPSSAGEVVDALRRGGLAVTDEWLHGFRLSFASGADAAAWLQRSGYVVHPALGAFSAATLAALVADFARRLDEYRDAEGVPLDFTVAAVIAERP